MRVAAPALVLAAALSQPALAAGRCDYQATLRDPVQMEMTVAARCKGVSATGFIAPRSALSEWIEVLQREPGGSTIRYRVKLGPLAERSGSPDVARRVGGMIVSPIPNWLMEPEDSDAQVSLKLRAEDGLQAALNLKMEDGAYRLMAEDVAFGGYAAFGRFERERLDLPGGAVEIAHSPGPMALDGAGLRQAVGDAASAVAAYYGRAPVGHTLVVALPGGQRAGIEFGRVRGGGGATVMLRFGSEARAADLRREWVLVHELIHVGGPFVIRGFWLTEGMATYAEPIIRARAGWRSAEDLWMEFATDMPRGLDGLTRDGLDFVARRNLYWGGALFMLLADLDIREKTRNRASLETCFRAVLAAGGDATSRWSKERFYQVCDAGAGTDTMKRLAAEYVEKPGSLDLGALWRDLGVILEEGRLRLDDAAPRAHLRRAITEGPAPN